MNKFIAIGIDPGKSGYITLLHYDESNYHPQCFPIPMIGKEYDLREILKIFRGIQYDSNILHACLENVHAIQGAGRTSNFTFGYGVGILEMALASNEIPYTKVHPLTWQKTAWEGVTIQYIPCQKNKSGKKKDTKATSLLAVKRLFPNVDLRKTERSEKPHDGKIDSLLIAYYCMKTKF